jgi:hypothetical protein
MLFLKNFVNNNIFGMLGCSHYNDHPISNWVISNHSLKTLVDIFECEEDIDPSFAISFIIIYLIFGHH